jgi:hypothetical protein
MEERFTFSLMIAFCSILSNGKTNLVFGNFGGLNKILFYGT